jgi:hypothetical protein
MREIKMEMQQALKPDRESVPFYNSCISQVEGDYPLYYPQQFRGSKTTQRQD